ncbi:MAG: GTP 3',8-cyclase MoaA [Anaerolineales bacterium]
MITDTLSRPLSDLRISVTDRCNFRCVYCMPKEVFGRDFRFLSRDELLSFEEIEAVARAFHTIGVRKIRLTGGEPLVRNQVEQLVTRLSELPDTDLTMTTNGILLSTAAEILRAAGLKRVTVSLDSLEDAVFHVMNDVGASVQDVLRGIEAAERAGLHPIKINMVVKRGVNEGSVLPMARYFKEHGHILRFIEYMDVGHTNGWRMDQVVPASEIVERIGSEMALEPVEANYRGEVANRYRYLDGSGEIGIIASVTQPFCQDCTRIRLSADGLLYTCLFAVEGHDLRRVIRSGPSPEELVETISSVWTRRVDRYSELRSAATQGLQKIEMSYIGG